MTKIGVVDSNVHVQKMYIHITYWGQPVKYKIIRYSYLYGNGSGLVVLC